MKRYFKDSALYRYIISAIKYRDNYKFCKKYPFWKMRNSLTGKFLGYETTWYDHIEPGWQKAFGIKLSEDIVKALKEDKIPKRKWYKNIFWDDIKEKWGSLCLYCETTDKVQDVLDKYEILSMCYCIQCGAPVRYKTSDWIVFLCPDCFEKSLNWLSDEQKDEARLKHRVAEKDVPCIMNYNMEKRDWEQVSYKQKYKIDFEKLWGLK